MLDVRISHRLSGFELDVRFQADKEITVLFGPSGSGKSLTLQCIAGIVRPKAGRIAARGRVLFDSEAGVSLPARERRIGYVPQNYALFPHLTVEENIAYGLRGLSAAQRTARVQEMVSLTALGGLESRRPRELSGGQQQRVALARALAFRPDVLLLDEPFSSVDAGIRGELREELLALQRRAAVTTLVVTHDLEDAFLLGQRMAVIDDGHVLQEGPREDVFYRPKSRRVAEFGRTRNVLRGTVLSVDAAAMRIGWRGRVLEAAPQPLAPDTPVDICIRPTQIMIVRPDRATTEPRHNVFHGRIVQESVQAETYRLFVQLAPTDSGSSASDPEPVEHRSQGDDEQAAHDLEIELPGYVYFRLGLDRRKDVTVSIRRDIVHVIPRAAC